jgi:hypothetical protein
MRKPAAAAATNAIQPLQNATPLVVAGTAVAPKGTLVAPPLNPSQKAAVVAKLSPAKTITATELDKDPTFAALPPAVQKAVLARIAAEPSTAGKNNYAQLATSPGFAKLSPAGQEAALDALSVAPGNGKVLWDVTITVNSSEVQALAPATQKTIFAHLKVKDDAVRAHYSMLATTPGFSKQPLAHQDALIATLVGSPKDEALVLDLQRFVESKAIQALPLADRTKLLAKLAAPTDRAAILGVIDSEAWKHLSADEQKTFVALLGGDSAYAKNARPALAALVRSKAFVEAKGFGKTEQLQAFLAERSWLPDTTTAPAGTFTKTRAAYTIIGPIGMGGTKIYQVEIDGRKYPVKIEAQAPGKYTYTIDDVAKCLAGVPKKQRETIKGVVLTHDPHPTYPGAYMGSNSSGIVEVYPHKVGDTLEDEDFMASAVVHESGHIISNSAWGDDTSDPRWETWKKAMASDAVYPSVYGSGKPGDESIGGSATQKAVGGANSDDFAEFVQMYYAVKGTPQEAETRRLFPERYRIYESM